MVAMSAEGKIAYGECYLPAWPCTMALKQPVYPTPSLWESFDDYLEINNYDYCYVSRPFVMSFIVTYPGAGNPLMLDTYNRLQNVTPVWRFEYGGHIQSVFEYSRLEWTRQFYRWDVWQQLHPEPTPYDVLVRNINYFDVYRPITLFTPNGAPALSRSTRKLPVPTTCCAPPSRPSVSTRSITSGSGVGGAQALCQLPTCSQAAYVRIPRWESHMRPYFQVNWQLYPHGTAVISFPKKLSEDEFAAVKRGRDCWEQMETDIAGEVSVATSNLTHTLKPGETWIWFESPQAGCLRSFSLKMTAPDGATAWARSRLLRQLVLSFTWNE